MKGEIEWGSERDRKRVIAERNRERERGIDKERDRVEERE